MSSKKVFWVLAALIIIAGSILTTTVASAKEIPDSPEIVINGTELEGTTICIENLTVINGSAIILYNGTWYDFGEWGELYSYGKYSLNSLSDYRYEGKLVDTPNTGGICGVVLTSTYDERTLYIAELPINPMEEDDEKIEGYWEKFLADIGTSTYYVGLLESPLDKCWEMIYNLWKPRWSWENEGQALNEMCPSFSTETPYTKIWASVYDTRSGWDFSNGVWDNEDGPFTSRRRIPGGQFMGTLYSTSDLEPYDWFILRLEKVTTEYTRFIEVTLVSTQGIVHVINGHPGGYIYITPKNSLNGSVPLPHYVQVWQLPLWQSE